MKSQTLTSVVISLSMLVVAQLVHAQDGPAVEVFTNRDTARARITPLERLPVVVSVSVNAGYDDNVNTSSSNEQDSFFSDASVNLSYAFGTSRTRVSLSTNAGVSYYAGGDFEYNPNLALSVGVSHSVSERLSLNSSIFLKYGLEPDFSIDAGENRRTGNYFYTADSISASYQWLERFSTVTSYSLGVIKYEDEIRATFQDRFDHGFSNQFRFLLLPITTLIGEYRFGFVKYTGDDRDSATHSLLAGLDHSFGPRSHGSFRAGAEFRSSEQEDSNTLSPYVDASFSYVLGEKTSMSWSARYSTEESDIIEASRRSSLRTGLSLQYGLTPRISSSASCYYRHDMNEGSDEFLFAQPSFSEDSVDLDLNVSYAVTSRLSANVGYHRTEVFSESSNRSYSRSRYSSGIGYSF